MKNKMVVKILNLEYWESKVMRWPIGLILLSITLLNIFTNAWLTHWYIIPINVAMFWITYDMFMDYHDFKEMVQIFKQVSKDSENEVDIDV